MKKTLTVCSVALALFLSACAVKNNAPDSAVMATPEEIKALAMYAKENGETSYHGPGHLSRLVTDDFVLSYWDMKPYGMSGSDKFEAFGRHSGWEKFHFYSDGLEKITELDPPEAKPFLNLQSMKESYRTFVNYLKEKTIDF